ncbi:Uma2 family endonuclease [Chroogloeocystis siderophila]|jgi:Uma2 family endonuclease|uniref:Uma2 family endonuclease n=1 Tax=Chroogloeocystis siderophila TaxID=329163 RepID=UPI000A8C1E59|nr:Uma2 family endonuclease [Chroogloeocystis siderophila]
MTQALEQRTYTPEEYLNFEVNSDERHEYINQEIIPMTDGTPAHNEIASILNAALRGSLKGKPYSIFVADQRLWISEVISTLILMLWLYPVHCNYKQDATILLPIP